MLARIRRFFDGRGVLEVETPLLSPAATTEPALASLTTVADPGIAGGAPLYLHTSPELPMKRLVAAGSGPIFQVCKVFRGGERGRRHHPEFTLLEWYRPGWGIDALMDEVADLVRAALARPDLADARIGYRALFRDRLGVDPWTATPQALAAVAAAHGIAGAQALDLGRDGWLDLLLATCLEPGLGRGGMTFLRDYPPSQAALARIRPSGDATDSVPVAARFELYIDGLELANGFDELTDAAEQRARLRADLETRAAAGLPAVPIDERFLAALEAGMPACSGVALGVDRLLMIALGAAHIDEVIAFPIERA